MTSNVAPFSRAIWSPMSNDLREARPDSFAHRSNVEDERALLEVREALGESDDVVDHVRGEIGHVWQSRENAALRRLRATGGREGRAGGREGAHVGGLAAVAHSKDVPVHRLRETKKGWLRLLERATGLSSSAHPEAAEAVKLQVKGLAVAIEELTDGFFLLGRELDGSVEHLFPLKADPPLHDLLL